MSIETLAPAIIVPKLLKSDIVETTTVPKAPQQPYITRLEFEEFKKQVTDYLEQSGEAFAETESESRAEIASFESQTSHIDKRFDQVLEAVGKIQRFAYTQQFTELVGNVENLMGGQTRLNDRLNSVERRLSGIDGRLDRLDGRLDKIEGLLSQLLRNQ